MAPDDELAASDWHLAAVRTLAVDAAAVQVADAMRADGINPVLIKGATLAHWLYDDALRLYGDVDLLVAPAEVAAAERLLSSLEFRTGPGHAPPATPHARPWRRPADGTIVDLHWTISGSCVGPATTVATLQQRTCWLALGGGQVRALDRIASALVVVLHASQHGGGKPLEDLDRLLAQASLADWRAVRVLAGELDAEYGLGNGLRLHPQGRRVAAQLGLPPPALLEAARTPHSALVLGLERLGWVEGKGARIRLLLREAFPAPDFMRWRFRLARRGRRGLVTAYLWRLGWLVWRVVPSLVAWRRTRLSR